MTPFGIGQQSQLFCIFEIINLKKYLMLTRAEILAFLKDNKGLFRSQYGIRKIGLFGSYAREEQTDTSDIDILIEMSPDTENIFDKRMQLRELLMSRFAKNVDICHEQAIRPIFKKLVLNDAIYA